MYFGEYERTVDAKGRVTLPAHLLVSLNEQSFTRVMLLKGEPRCLFLYDLDTWKGVLNEAYTALPDDEGRVFMHRMLSDAQVSDVDNLKRITIPAPLLEHAQIERRVVIVGMFNRLEVWSPEVWKEYVDSMADVEVPSIADLSRARIREVS